MANAINIINAYCDEYGWTDATMISLFSRFLDEDENLRRNFVEFLAEVVNFERESSNEDS